MYHDLCFDQKVREISEFSFKLPFYKFEHLCIMHGHVWVMLFAIFVKLLLYR